MLCTYFPLEQFKRDVVCLTMLETSFYELQVASPSLFFVLDFDLVDSQVCTCLLLDFDLVDSQSFRFRRAVLAWHCDVSAFTFGRSLLEYHYQHITVQLWLIGICL